MHKIHNSGINIFGVILLCQFSERAQAGDTLCSTEHPILVLETNTFVYFEFLHGHIQHVNVLDQKKLFRPFKRVTEGKNMVKYEEMSCFIEACTPLHRETV